MKKCPYCGAQIADDSRFCSECGKEYPQGSVCPHCGASVGEGDVFCQNCGKSLNESRNGESITYEEELPKSGFKKCLPYIIGAIILVAICGGGWYGYKEYSAYTEKKIAREKFVADSLEQVRKELVDSPKFDSQKSNEAVKEKQIETISDDANSKMHNFGLHSKHHHHLTGTFEDSSGIYPIELDFNSSGRDVSDVIYKNVKLGGKIPMTCTYFDYSSITVKGKDGKNDFSISLDCTSRNSFRGTAIDGEKEFVVVMEANCQHE